MADRNDNNNRSGGRGLVHENEALQTRLNMAQAFVGMLHKAYDALLHYNINYRTLPEYQDDTAIADAHKVPVQEAQANVVTWLGRVERAIAAAIRRKTFRRID